MALAYAIPVELTTTTVTDFSVAETVAAWSAVTAYATGNNVYRVIDGIHMQFEALQAGTNKIPENEPLFWADLGPTNAWAWADAKRSTRTTAANEIEGEIAVPASQRIDCFYAAGLVGVSLRLQVYDTVSSAMVYDITHSLSDASFITDWRAYFYAPLAFKDELLIVDLPDGAGSVLTFTLDHSGDTAELGAVATGYRVDLGNSQWGWNTTLRDYSRFEEDDVTGDRVLVERNYRKLASGNAIVDNRVKDAVERLLTGARARVRLYVADDDFTSLTILGLARWSNEMSLPPDYSLMSIQLESNV